jgi:hypothetical protein
MTDLPLDLSTAVIIHEIEDPVDKRVIFHLW